MRPQAKSGQAGQVQSDDKHNENGSNADKIFQNSGWRTGNNGFECGDHDFILLGVLFVASLFSNNEQKVKN
jgi:hypothetical protein